MNKSDLTYLEWRCRMNWHPKYLKYINEWISNVINEQLDYMINVEKKHLIESGEYNIGI